MMMMIVLLLLLLLLLFTSSQASKKRSTTTKLRSSVSTRRTTNCREWSSHWRRTSTAWRKRSRNETRPSRTRWGKCQRQTYKLRNELQLSWKVSSLEISSQSLAQKSCCRSEIYFVLLSSGKANLRSQEEKPGTRKVQVRVGLQNQGAEEANRTARKWHQSHEGANPGGTMNHIAPF